MSGKLSMLKGRAKRVAAVACASALVLFALAGTVMPSTALAAEEPAFQPDVHKDVRANTDGTYTVSLSVTGKQKSSEETVKQKADVILVMDVSDSMEGKTDGKQWLEWAQEAAKGLVNNLIQGDESEDVNIAIVPFGTIAKAGLDFTGVKKDINGAIENLEVDNSQDEGVGKTGLGRGTNIESALGIANSLKGRDDAQRYIVLLSDGGSEQACQRTDAAGHILTSSWNGSEEKGEWSYNGVKVENPIVNYEKRDQGYTATLYQSFADWCAIDAGIKKGASTRFFTVKYGEDKYGTDYEGRLRKIHKAIAGNETDFKLGKNSKDLIDAFDDISQTIVKTAAFQDVVITDTLNSQYAAGLSSDNKLLAAGKVDPSTFTYWTKNGDSAEQSWTPTAAQQAIVDKNGKITWDLSSLGKLPANVTYKVSFKIAPTQAAFDKAGEDDQDFPFDSNGVASASFKPVTTVNGKDQVGAATTVSLPSGKMTAKLSTLTINKVWPTGEDHSGKDEKVVVHVSGDDHSQHTVTLTSGSNWTGSIKLPGGPTGHTYTIEEAEVLGYDATYSKSSITFVGLTPESDTVTITNKRSSGSLLITKTVSGGAANTGEHFTFDLEAKGELAGLLTGEYDATYKMDDGSEADKGKDGHPAKIAFTEGKAQVKLRHNETAEIKGLPAGVIINVSEQAPDKAYTSIESKLDNGNYAEISQLDATVVASPAQVHVYFKNTASAAPDAGVRNDSTPMVGLFAAAVIGGTALYAANRGKRGQDAWKE